jgi:hypothetical protein
MTQQDKAGGLPRDPIEGTPLKSFLIHATG